MMDRWIWISWEGNRRTRELCKDLGIPLYKNDFNLPRVFTHPYLTLWTIWIISRFRPNGLIVQNPSILLSLCAVLLKRIFKYVLVIDAHNAGVMPPSNWHKKSVEILKYLHKRADMTIVTNERLADIVTRNGGRPFVLEDKLPDLNPGTCKSTNKDPAIACVSTFDIDEPIEEIMKAARLLQGVCKIFVTGNSKRLPARLIKEKPPNVFFTGYLCEEEYVGLLRDCDVVLDLTTLEDCLVCGAYEALALEKPVVLSDTFALRSYFLAGATYTKNNAEAIKSAVISALGSLEERAEDAKLLKQELKRKWQSKRDHLVSLLNNLTEISPQ